MGKIRPVRLRRRVILVKWKCKSRRVIRVKRYFRWWLQIPAGLNVSDLAGKPLKAYREGKRLIFEPAEEITA